MSNVVSIDNSFLKFKELMMTMDSKGFIEVCTDPFGYILFENNEKFYVTARTEDLEDFATFKVPYAFINFDEFSIFVDKNNDYSEIKIITN